MHEFWKSLPQGGKSSVRKVILPSGRVIEFVDFKDLASAETELHVCPECSSELVYPVDFEEVDKSHWEVSLRCPNCEWTTTGTYEEDAIQRFDEMLDRGTTALVASLRQLTRANMDEEVERFVLALNADHVLPEDF